MSGIFCMLKICQKQLKTVNSSELLLSVEKRGLVFGWLVFGATSKYKIGGHGEKELELSLENERWCLLNMEEEIKFNLTLICNNFLAVLCI